jgi:hypothetical protein
MRFLSAALVAGPFAILAGLLAAPSVQAQEVIGEVRATLDGAERQWQTLQSTDPGMSLNTGVEQFGPVTSITIQGYEEGGSYTREVISLNWSVMGDGAPMDVSVMYVPERMSQSWMNPEGEQVLTVEAFDGESARGTLSGRLCYKDGFAAPPDPENCIVIEGTFETQLPADP